MARITTGWTEDGKQQRQVIGYFETKSEAMDALSLHHVNPVSPKAGITLGELYQEWSEGKYKYISRATRNNYKAAWKYIEKLEKAKFKELRTSHWQKIIDQNEETLSHSSLKKIKGLIVLLYKHALQNDIVNKNYGEFVALPKEAKKEKEIFTDLDIKTMFDHAEAVPWVDTILIMIYSGMRISEMLQLTKFNVDLDKQLITGGIKTEAGRNRVVPIHPKIYPYIKKWYNRNGETLICREDGKGMSAKYYREKKYYPALEQLGIRKLTPHACRHTFASMLAEAKVDTLHIQRLIGHADYAFTANTYTHLEVEKLRKAISNI